MPDERSKQGPDSTVEPTPSRRNIELVGAPSWRPGRRLGIASQILDILHEAQIDAIFGIPGGAISSLYGAIHGRREFRLVTAKHETGAMFMAMGYSLATGRPAAVMTTAGPGVTNALTGIASAYYDGVPILVLSGEVSTVAFGRGALQEGSPSEVDVVSLMRRTTKFAAQVTRPDTATLLVRKALAASLTGRRGPSFLSLPLNIGAADVVESPPISGSSSTSFEVDEVACRRAMELLLEAQRPLLLIGSGARSGAGRAMVRRLAEATAAPVAATPKAKGIFPEDHPLYLGVFGFGGHESVVEYLAGGVDVVLVCGSGLNDFATNAWSPALAATKAFIQIDIDTARLGRNYPIDLGIIGPIDKVLSHMLSLVPPTDSRPVPPSLHGVSRQRLRPSASGALTTADAVMIMNEECPPDAVFTADMGEHLGVALHYLRIGPEGDFLTCLGFGSMGSGIGTAIGYQMGAPSRRVYAICGDGCFLMYGSELATAVQHQLPVTLAVVNDSCLNMCRFGLQDLFGASVNLDTQLVDFSAIARGMGATAFVVHTREELVAALRHRAPGPVLLDIRIDRNIRLEGSQRNAALRQFRAV